MVRANTLVVALFDLIDRNHDGKIDEVEGRKFFTDIGTHPDEVGYYWEDLSKWASTEKMISKKDFLQYTLGNAALMQDGTLEDEEMEQKIRTQLGLVSHTGTLAANLFDKLDADGSGHLDLAEGIEYLRMLGSPEHQLEWDWSELLRKADADDDGLVSKSEFLAYCFSDVPVDDDGFVDDYDLADELRFQIICRGPAGQLTGCLFDLVDQDQSGFLDAVEGRTYLSLMGCDPADLEYYWSDLRRCADTDGDGRVSKSEFNKYLLSDMELDDDGQFIELEHERKLRRQIARMGDAGLLCSRLFDCLDRDGSGYLEHSEVRAYLEMSGCAEHEVDYYLKDLLRVADENGDGLIEKVEFLDYVLGDERLDNIGSFVDQSAREDLVRRLQQNGPAAQLIGALFDIIDQDGSGALQEDEGKIFLGLQGCNEAELDYYWTDLKRCVDHNADGNISKSEFVEYVMNDAELTEDGSFIHAEEEAKIKCSLARLGPAGKLCGALFDLIDSDQSGYMEEAEGRKFLQLIGTEESELDYYWSDLSRAADQNGDGKISKLEFMEYTLGDEEISNTGNFANREFEQDLRNQVRMLCPAGQNVSTLFNLIDKDGSGYLEESEGKLFLSCVGCDVDELDYYWDDLLRTADANKDGKISKSEFMQYTMGDIELDSEGQVDVEFVRDLQQKIALMGVAGTLINTLFDCIDIDGSGYLEQEEGKKFFGMIGCEASEVDYYWQDLIRAADRNGDGKISKEEFIKYSLLDEEIDDTGNFEDTRFEIDMRRKIAVMGPAGTIVAALFDAIDTDGSGVMEEPEARQFLQIVGCPQSDLGHYWQDLIRTADTNHDGNISRDEFVAYIMGEEELTLAGEFKHHERRDEIVSQVKALGGALPRSQQQRASASAISEGVPPLKQWSGIRSYVADSALIEAIVSALGGHGTMLAVAEPACLALWNYTSKNQEGLVVEAIGMGLVRAVASAMGMHANSARIQEAGCGVFWAVTHASAKGRASVVDEGGLDATVVALRGRNTEERMVEAACATIGNLAMEHQLYDRLIGLESDIAQAMAAFPGSDRVQAAACAALRNLSVR